MTAWVDWTGFGDYTGPLTKDQREKTLWDWLELLIIPLVLGVGALLFNKAERANELKIAEQRNKNDQELATDRQREQALQSYIDKMTELLLDRSIRESEPQDESRAVARTRTLTTLRLLDSTRKGILLRFLFEAGLINKGENIVNLEGADLTSAILMGAKLEGANLANVNLMGALLMGTYLENANLKEAHLMGADLMDATLVNAVMEGADLRDADLMSANLTTANLRGAYLRGANFRFSDLQRADLANANLMDAQLMGANLKDANLMGANLEGAMMPNGEIYNPTIHQF